MASTREERMQSRLRGAQRRQIKEVDFGFTFAPPAAPASVRRSPRRSLDLAPQPSTRPTPRSRSQPPVATPADEPAKSATTHSTFDANISAKRRKLDSDGPSTSQRSTRSSLPAPRDIYALPADDDAQPAANTTDSIIEQSTDISQVDEQDDSILAVPQRKDGTPSPSMLQDEITESPLHAPGSGHRRRTLVVPTVESSLLEDELQDSTAQLQILTSPTSHRKRKWDVSIPNTIRSRRSRSRSQSRISNISVNSEVADELSVLLNTAGDVDELSPEQPKRGRRRRSSIQRESIVTEADSSRGFAEEIPDVEAAAILQRNKGRGKRAAQASPNGDEPFERSEQPAGVQMKKGRGRRRAEASPDLDEPSERSRQMPKSSRPNGQSPASSPAQQRQPKKAALKAVKKPSKKAKKQVRSGSPIPVTVHRLTKAPVYDDDESDADILNTENPYAKRGSANAIDVLAQVCKEVIDSSLDTIQEHRSSAQDNAAKREFRDKHRYVQAFGRELETRLLEHTINLDNNPALAKRLRVEQRKKVALREEILQVRAARGKVALRMDAVRIRHEEESKDAQERDTLNASIHDIELAVERGKENDPHDPALGPVEKDGIELLLKRVASHTSDSGGLLQQIKQFNRFLEETAILLESRRV